MEQPKDRTCRVEQDVLHENKGNLRHLFRLFGTVFRSAPAMCAIFLGLTILLSLLRPVLAWLWGRYINLAAAYQPGRQILPMIVLILAYYLIGFLCDLLQRYTQNYEQIERLDVVQLNQLQEQFDTRVYAKIAGLSPEYLEVPRINDTIKRVFEYTQNGWDGLNREIMVNGYLAVAKIVSVISIAATLWLFHPLLTLIVLIGPVPAIYTATAGNRLKFRLIRDNSKLKRECDYYQDLMLGPAAKEIKALGLHGFFHQKWQELADRYAAAEKKVQVRTAWLNTLNNTLAALAAAGASILAILMMAAGRISIGALGSVLSLVQTLIADAGTLFSAVATFIAKKNEAAAFFDLADLPEQRQSGNDSGPIVSIEARNLKYRYPLTDRYVLDNVSLSIRKGEKIALVGENGAGKTTFVKLVSGMLEPSAGDLLINGQSQASIRPGSRYAAMSAVFQDPVHYQTFTVGDNVRLGDISRDSGSSAPLPAVSAVKPASRPADPAPAQADLQVAAALTAAGFTGADPDALLGKDIGGTELSGGQWQKLAIARAYYRDRDFVILDEPTSNLDPLAEADIFRRYIELARERTVLLVTHRISIAALCDRIVVFADGQVVEDGSHAELMASNGEYARLHNEQAQWYER